MEDRGGPLPIKTVNVVVCGDAGVGKSALVRRFVEDEWEHRSQATTGMEYTAWHGLPDAVPEPRFEIKMNLWDVGGQERFRDSIASLFKTADVVLFAFDVTDKSSLESVSSRWLGEARWEPRDGGWGRTRTLAWLVGTKADLEEERAVDAGEALRVAASRGMPYIETSSLSGNSVRLALQTIVHYVHDTDVGSVAGLADDLLPDDGYYVQTRRFLCCVCVQKHSM